MSLQVMGWAVEFENLPVDKKTGRFKPTCKLVLMALANRASTTGTDAFPSEAEIQRFTGLSVRMIQYCLQDMEAHGTIIRTPNPLVRAQTITNPDRWPNSWDIVAFPGYQHGVQDLKPGSGERSQRGARSQKVSAETKVDLAPEPVLQTQPQQPEPKTSVEASASTGRDERDTVTDTNPQDLQDGVAAQASEARVSTPDQRDGATSSCGVGVGTQSSADDQGSSGASTDLFGATPPATKPAKSRRRKTATEKTAEDDAHTTNAHLVVKAWIDAYRQYREGAQPSRQRIQQVGKEAKGLLVAENDLQSVIAAAVAAGRVGFATVEREFANIAARACGNGHVTSGAPAPNRVRDFTSPVDQDEYDKPW